MAGFQIDPKVQMGLAAGVALLTLVAKGSVALPMGVSPEIGQYVTSWSNFVLQIYAVLAPVLLGFSSSQPGPLAPQDAPVVVAAEKVADLPTASTPKDIAAAKADATAAVAAHQP